MDIFEKEISKLLNIMYYCHHGEEFERTCDGDGDSERVGTDCEEEYADEILRRAMERNMAIDEMFQVFKLNIQPKKEIFV